MRRDDLAQFLRSRREQLQPEDVGLPRRGPRRVKGLRREEVAYLANVSITWYTWLEQGREIHASAQSLDAVCSALRLDEDAWRYVRGLAGKPLDARRPSPTTTSPALTALLRDLLPSPACVVTGPYDLLAWNSAYMYVFGDPADLPAEHRNLVWMSFVNDEFRSNIVDWPRVAKVAIAYLRAEAAKHGNDSRFGLLVAQISETSEEFRSAWDQQEVRQTLAIAPTIMHPEIGELHLQVLQLVPSDEPDQTVVVLFPTDEQTRERLSRRTTIGIREPSSPGASA